MAWRGWYIIRVFLESNAFVALVIVVGVAIAVMAYLSAKWQEQRRQALEQLAGALGLRFSREDPIGIPGTFAQFELFQQGETRYAYNVIHGTLENRHYFCCDFQYTVVHYTTDNKGHTRRHETTTYCSAALVELNYPVPAIWLRQENFLDKAAQLVGFSDLEFESDEFNRAFHVKAMDREIAFGILTPQTMQRLLASPFRNIEFNGAAVLVFDQTLWQPEHFTAAIDLVRSLAEGLPNYLHQKLRDRAQS